jgi:hypothetical protein
MPLQRSQVEILPAWRRNQNTERPRKTSHLLMLHARCRGRTDEVRRSWNYAFDASETWPSKTLPAWKLHDPKKLWNHQGGPPQAIRVLAQTARTEVFAPTLSVQQQRFKCTGHVHLNYVTGNAFTIFLTIHYINISTDCVPGYIPRSRPQKP